MGINMSFAKRLATYTAISIAPLAVATYLVAGFTSNDVKKAKEDIQPAWEHFQAVVKSERPKLEEIGNTGSYELDYHGKLNPSLGERNEILDAYGVIKVTGGWRSKMTEWNRKYVAIDDLVLFDPTPWN